MASRSANDWNVIRVTGQASESEAREGVRYPYRQSNGL